MLILILVSIVISRPACNLIISIVISLAMAIDAFVI